MKFYQRLIACILIICMVLPMMRVTSVASGSGAEVTGNSVTGFTITNEDGTREVVDESWAEKYPYGIFALGKSQLVVTEGGDQEVLTVYRLGGTTNKASAIIYYQPAVVKNADGSLGYSSAISADDISIMVEEPLPITKYQAWGKAEDPEKTDVKINVSDGFDGQGEACTILSLTNDEGVESFQWYAFRDGIWEKINLAEGSELPVGQEDLDSYDFRCVFELKGISYCTDSYKGEVYEKSEEEQVPQAPANIELNPNPTYEELILNENNNKYNGVLFELCFANGEYKKDIIISAKDNSKAELDKYATLTIADSIGGDVHQALNTLMLSVLDNDGDNSEPSQVGFSTKSISFDKSEGKALLTIKRTGGLTKAISIDWSLEDGSAKAGTDFISDSGTLYFYGDQNEQTIEIELINDKVENLNEKDFVVRLDNLLGDDKSSISLDTCRVGLYNSNTAKELNLASTLYDINAVDLSSAVSETPDAPISPRVITGSQVTGSEGLDIMSVGEKSYVDWGSDSGGLDPLIYKYGKIYFYGGSWGETSSVSMSLKSKGGESTYNYIPNMGKLYSSFTANVYGGAEFASVMDRFWYGNEEYAYTVFGKGYRRNPMDIFPTVTRRWDCSPRFWKEGSKVYLSANNPFRVSDSWDYTDSNDIMILSVATYETRQSENPVNASANMKLSRRTFNNDFSLDIYTANDEDITNPGVAKYTSDNYNAITPDVVISDGGQKNGKLYQGSTVKVEVRNTHLVPVLATIIDGSGNKVFTGSVSGNTATFSNLILPPDGAYTFRLVLDRKQSIKIDVNTSSKLDSLGNPVGSMEAANLSAYDLLLRKNTKDKKITIGYTSKIDNLFDKNNITEKDLEISNTNGSFDKIKGVFSTNHIENIQYINFNLTEKDVILFNGKAYAGNELIRLETKHLTPKDLTFYFYEEDFLTAERPMRATLDSTALYFDANGNGRIDGYFNESSGIFVPEDGDLFISYMDDIDYEETTFRPIFKDGKVHQYFMRPYYTANPVCLEIPKNHNASERMQIMPNFITDVTNSTTYESLTEEQKQYRTIISGKSKIKKAGSNSIDDIGYTGDNKLKYTAAASAYSFVDIPLGGDKSPARPVTAEDLTGAPQNGQYIENGITYMLMDGLAYYYSASGPSNLGNAVYTWSPDYEGNLLYKFDSPQPIFIANSLAGNRIPITKDPDSNNGREALNNYLGAFGGDDTFALVINEQEKDTDEILTGLGILEDTNPVKETITRGTVGVFPDASYMKQNGGDKSKADGDSGGQGEMEEFSTDVDSELFSFSSEALSLFSIETDGYEVSFSIGIPIYGKDNGGGSGSAANTLDDTKEVAGKVRDFIKAIKNPATGQTKKDSFKKLAGEDLDANKLKSKSVEFTVTVSLAITFKYNPLDNSYMFSEGAIVIGCEIELRLQYRFTPVPIVYVYAQFGAEVTLGVGLGQNRVAEFGDPILPKGEDKEVTLYEVIVSGTNQRNQYYFTSDQKAFSITFSGKLYMECFEFEDKNGNNYYDHGDEIGDKLEGFSPGYISSDGKEETEIVLKGQDKFALEKPVVVFLTVKDDGKPYNNAKANITSLKPIKGVKQDFYFSGFKLEIEGSIELGVGVGIEIAKAELFAKANIGVAITFASYQGEGEYKAATIDDFSLSAGIAFRIVLLFFNFEMDLIEYHLNYDGDDWTHGWSALGGSFGGDSSLGLLGEENDGKIHVYITPPSQVKAHVYNNNVTYKDSDMEDLAYNTNAKDFQVSGYGSSVNAFKLLDKVETGYDYRIVTVGENNYVVYTGTREGNDVEAVDNTQLMLSKLQQTDNAYGFVNPIAGKTTDIEKAISVDNDEAGDLDFYTWAEGNKIHVIWVTYATKAISPVNPGGDPYSNGSIKMDKDNYLTIGKPDGGTYSKEEGTFILPSETLLIDGTEVKANNYDSVTIEEVSDHGEGPAEAYQAYVAAKASLEEWVLYYKWYNYFGALDNQNKVVSASQNTLVKHASFDTTDENARGFTDPNLVSENITGKYYFLPQAVKEAAVYAQSVPYNEQDLKEQVDKYEAYLNTTMTMDGSDNSPTSQSYINAAKSYRMAYQQSMLSIYGGNSKLTVTKPDGTPYADGTMYVSKHQEDGNGVPENQTREILTNIQLTEIDGRYYLAYVTQQDTFEMDGPTYKDIRSISRLYLRTFTIESNDHVTWGDPYLLRTIVNNEQDSKDDGLYDSSLSKTKGYIDPYIANLSFLRGALGDKLSGGEEESFKPFGNVGEETFLLFEMNGNTYVIKEDSLKSITDPSKNKGTISPFFTYDQLYGDAIEKNTTQNISSGKNEVVIGVDGDGNIAAVYTSSVPSTVNNAIYISYWDPETGKWGAGVMLAMNYMDVYENSLANDWDKQTTEGAYYNEALDGGMTSFNFSNLQIALGRKKADMGAGGLGGLGVLETEEGTTLVAEASEIKFADFFTRMGLPSGSNGLDALGSSYSKADIYALTEQAELLGFDTGLGTASASELLILTQGLKQELAEYTDSNKTIIAPKRDEVTGRPKAGNLGIYAISYGKGDQQVGNPSIRFSFNEFTVGSQLHAIVNFENVGDAAIRGSENQPVTVKLMLCDADGSSDTEMAKWEIRQMIATGQTVNLSTTDSPCKPLTSSLGTGDYFYLIVSEDENYTTGGTYTYNSSADKVQYKYNIENKPELGIEGFKSSVSGVEDDGDAIVELIFDVTNRGNKEAEEVFVQFSYVMAYDEEGNPIYAPLDLRDSELFVSQQKLIIDSLNSLGEDDLSKGIIYLGTDEGFYTDDYYITENKYKEILGDYYIIDNNHATAPVPGWIKGEYGGNYYWYNKLYHISAYAAYTAGQEAVKDWTLDNTTKYYYKNRYPSYTAAKEAADEGRKGEYFITAAAYNALSATEKNSWVKCEDNTSFYTLTAYKTYAVAYGAYENALNDMTQNIISNYRRTVRGRVNISPDHFRGKVTGSLDIHLEVFSKSSSAGKNGDLYVSDHNDEYYLENNRVSAQIEHTSYIGSAPKITLALASTHRLPISIRTTTGKAPQISLVEVEDGGDEISTLYYSPDTDKDDVVSTETGTIFIVANTLGSGVIHVIDNLTNTTYPITYTVVEAGEGTNIYNNDAQFTFYNKDMTAYKENELNQSWKFTELPEWTNKQISPYLRDIAIGEEGAYFTFETKASKISFDMVGSAIVTSNKFPGSFTVSNDGSEDGTTNPPTTGIVDFGNESSLSHIVTVKVIGATAQFDTVRLAYSQDYKPSDDILAPGIFWNRSFPTGNSVETGDSLEFTVYAIDESGLHTFSYNDVTLDGSKIKKESNGLWSYTFNVTDNSSFTVSATDTNGNKTSRRVEVDWFKENPEKDAKPYGKKPELTDVTAYKVYENEPDKKDDIFLNPTLVMTADDIIGGNKILLSAATDEGCNLSYYEYDGEKSMAFIEMLSEGNPSPLVQRNGYYMIRSDNPTYQTWSAKILYIDCFENAPEIKVTKTWQTLPNSYKLEWRATKDEESTAKLKSIKVNNIDISSKMEAGAMAYSSFNTVLYGGEYKYLVEDTKGVKGIDIVNLKVPIDISKESGAITHVNPWSQAENATVGKGTITIDCNKITGGDYTSASALAANSLDDYRGQYEFILLKEADYSGKTLPGPESTLIDNDDSWLTEETLIWEEFEYNQTHTWDGLEAIEEGEGKYLVIIRDALKPKSYSTMAYKEITLVDGSIKCVSLSSRLASSLLASDGEVYVSADKGFTGNYEFAILPLEVDTEKSTPTNTVYKSLTRDDFKEDSVKWKLSDWDSTSFSDVALRDLAPGGYQVAIRGFYRNDGKEMESMTALSINGSELENKRKEVENIEKEIQTEINSMTYNISEKSIDWREKSEKTASLKEVYDKLYARLMSGDKSVTSESVDNAYNSWQTALIEEEAAKTAYLTSITGADDDQKNNYISLRSAWLLSTSDTDKNRTRQVYETAIYDYCLAYWTNNFSAALTTARQEFEDAKTTYDDKAKEFAEISAQQYEADASLWDGMLTGEALQITVSTGTGTSIKAIPRNTSATDPTGQIRVNAIGGSAYDGGEKVYYQFAILPIKDKASARDYTSKMTDISGLGLEWKFAEDLALNHDEFDFTDLGSGWYQVFLRPVYDPNLRDGYDVNLNLYDATGNTADLEGSKKAYENAKAATEEKIITEKTNKVHSLYEKYELSKDQADYDDYLAAINSNTTVIDALDIWLATTEKAEKNAAYKVYRAALTDYFTELANVTLNEASLDYSSKLAELRSQVEKAYLSFPGNYDTASFTTVYVGIQSNDSGQGGSGQGGSGQGGLVGTDVGVKDVSYEEGQVTYKLEEGAKLPPAVCEQIVKDNKSLETHLNIGNRRVIIPAGGLKNPDEVSKLMNNFTGGTGNVVEFTDAQGNTRIVPISIIENGETAYMYMGEGSYRLVERSIPSFDDTSNHWANSSISFATSSGLFKGISDSLFAPNSSMNRAMLATVLYRMMGQPEAGDDPKISDLEEGKWYSEAIKWAYNKGIVSGVGENLFAPNRPVTRAEMVTMLYRFMSATGFSGLESSELGNYPDKEKVPSYSEEAFKWAVATGIISGDGEGRLNPLSNASRAEVATVFERFIRYILKG